MNVGRLCGDESRKSIPSQENTISARSCRTRCVNAACRVADAGATPVHPPCAAPRASNALSSGSASVKRLREATLAASGAAETCAECPVARLPIARYVRHAGRTPRPGGIVESGSPCVTNQRQGTHLPRYTEFENVRSAAPIAQWLRVKTGATNERPRPAMRCSWGCAARIPRTGRRSARVRQQPENAPGNAAVERAAGAGYDTRRYAAAIATRPR